MKKHKIGLVLGGGGAKGAYQAGALKAMKEANLIKNITYVSANSIGTINIYTSQDGETWQKQEYRKSTPVNTKNGWFRQNLLTPDSGINENANYLKIEVCDHPTKVWAPQFTRFDATMKNTSNLKNITLLLANIIS